MFISFVRCHCMYYSWSKPTPDLFVQQFSMLEPQKSRGELAHDCSLRMPAYLLSKATLNMRIDHAIEQHQDLSRHLVHLQRNRYYWKRRHGWQLLLLKPIIDSDISDAN